MNEKMIIDLTMKALEDCKGEKVSAVYATQVDGYGIVEIPLSFSKNLAQLVVNNLKEGILYKEKEEVE